jgi:hypothetical protein
MYKSEKFKNLVLFYQSDPIPLNNTSTRPTQSIIIRIQQATPKSPIKVNLQEMYRTADVDSWMYGRHNISIPIDVFINTIDPSMSSIISREILRLGLLSKDDEGDRELASIAPTPFSDYRFTMLVSPQYAEPWIKSFVDNGQCDEAAIHRYVDRVVFDRIKLTPDAISYICEHQIPGTIELLPQ